MVQIAASKHVVTVEGDQGAFRVSLSRQTLEEGLDVVHFRMESDVPQQPPSLLLKWIHPIDDIHAHWDPSNGRHKGFRPDWAGGLSSKATMNAPVISLFNLNGRNRLTFALSDALNPIKLHAGVHEESAEFYCSIKLFTEPSHPITVYEATLLLDTRDIPYYESLNHIAAWWETLPGYAPSAVPEIARLPMYSTWYSFHQQVEPEAIEEQCRIAKQLGCEAVIVDDGWQTSNNDRGYAYCGDWEVSPERIPDMRAHVDRVHALGMKYILWYSVPFVGVHSKAWSRFQGKFLHVNERLGAGTLDPRFPEVREYLINIYERAMIDWDLDGFKLDFVDMFNLSEEKKEELGGGRDCDSVPEAVDRLLTDVMERLQSIKPDVMIEFRQRYIGPLMRKYGNMFRVGDCPNDSIQNRVGSLDIRLLCGNTAAHSDMMMWHPEEPVESAALQIINSLFSVPQISVLLDRLPEQHYAMVRHWLAFWRQHRDVLLDGKLMPLHPETLYPQVTALTGDKMLTAVYSDSLIRGNAPVPPEVYVVNGTLDNRVVLELAQSIGDRLVEVFNCCGEPVTKEMISFKRGFHALSVPAAGYVRVAEI